ncbi:DUF664 domain-containing protein [Nonomuraea dietziae]|uniref:mycothiol transferase n=1 Tax=Nonomuraea dietziae TaxID=65515 RepID=UPI0034319431
MASRSPTRARQAPALGRIRFHLLHEYARHVGHLDVARQLIDGATGERRAGCPPIVVVIGLDLQGSARGERGTVDRRAGRPDAGGRRVRARHR